MLGLVTAVLVVVAASLAWALYRTRAERDAVVESTIAALGEAAPGQPSDRDLLDTAQRTMERLEAATAHTEVLDIVLTRAPIGVIVVDPAHTVVLASEGAERYLKGRHGDAVAEVQIRECLEITARSGTGATREIELYTPQRRVLGLQTVPITTDGDHTWVAVFLEDLTERHQVDAIRKDFVANASHELKTPLGALSVLAETLADAEDPDIRHRLAARLQDEAGRMSRLIDDILDLALVEDAASLLGPVVLDDVLAEAERQVSIIAEQYHVSIETKTAGDDVLVAGDRRQLVSATANLLENAVKYTHALEPTAGGTVWLRGFADDTTATLEIEDHGIGIPRQHQERIFERFYRVDRARSRETGGTGLGLAIARHVARNHDADIEVESTPGVGSTFRLTLDRWEE